MKWLSTFIYYKILGWKITGFTDFDSVKKAIFIAAPHTHWLDFPLGLLVRSTLGVKTNFIGKKSLFKWPYGWLFRALGGAPVEREKNEKQVEAIAKLFDSHEEFRLAMSPEGTRKKVEKWRTGFYYIAKTAEVPIIMFTLDFKNKQNHFSDPFYPSNNTEADFKFIKSFFSGVEGKIPEYS